MAISPDERELAGAAGAVLLFLTVFGAGAVIAIWLVWEFLTALM